MATRWSLGETWSRLLQFRDNWIVTSSFQATPINILSPNTMESISLTRDLLLALSAAAILGSIAFAAHHLVVTAQFFPFAFAFFLSICVGIGGMLWCWLYHRQGTLAGAWISHLIADAGLMTVGHYLLHQ